MTGTDLTMSTLRPAGSRGAVLVRVPALTILMHPDPDRVGEVARLVELLDGREAVLSRTLPLFASMGGDRPLTDPHLSRKGISITRTSDGLVLASRGGALRVDGSELEKPHVVGIAELGAGVVLELDDRVVLLLHELGLPAPVGDSLGFVGASEAVENLRREVAKVADLDIPVLVRGETGTGKELVAQAIHRLSRRAGPFVAVNMAAVPASMAASELFGHVRGAFTGAAHDRDGLFVRGAGGTLFLDEVGEIPFDVQPMLLRVLETREVAPLGGGATRRVDARVIAATDADLENQIAEAGFRAPLFHRLSGYQLLIPPLRDRRDDIGRLLFHFLRSELSATGDLARLDGRQSKPWLSASVVARFARFAWPGNVRQLRNAARQLAISNRGADEVRLAPSLERLFGSTPAAPRVASVEQPRRDVSAISDDEVLAALRVHRWSPVAAAHHLGVSRSTLYNLIDRSKRIRKVTDIPADELRRVFDTCGGDLEAAAVELEVSPRALKLRVADLS